MVPVCRCFLGIYPDKLRKILVTETDDMTEMWNKHPHILVRWSPAKSTYSVTDQTSENAGFIAP